MSKNNFENKEVIVNKIISFSSVDGPGNRMTIFLQGCNFDCLYCHNPETINTCNHCGRCVSVCPTGALTFTELELVNWQEKLCVACDQCLKICMNDSSPRIKIMNIQEIISEVKDKKEFISGITVSGGEACLHLDFLSDLFRKVKELGLSTFLDTNGSVLLQEKKNLLRNLDMAMIDFKAFKSSEHKMLTGLDNVNVLKNIELMAKLNKLYEVRTVIVPDLLENFYNVDQISKLLVSLNSQIRYKLIKYRDMGVRKDKMKYVSPEKKFMKKLVSVAKSNGCQNVIIV